MNTFTPPTFPLCLPSGNHYSIVHVSVSLSSHGIFSLCLCPNFCSYTDTSHNGLRAHTTLVWPHLNLKTSSKNLFQIKSHSQEPGVRTSRYLFGDDTIQPITDSLYRSDSKDRGKWLFASYPADWCKVCQFSNHSSE